MNVGEAFIKAVRKAAVRIRIDGAEVGTVEFGKAGWETARLQLEPAPEADVTVEFQAEPGFRPENDPRTLGIAVGGFGFQ